jgi:DNA uptake protein ComE-like DNA-binding protein
MYLNSEPIKNWFGFTRRERRSAFIMLLIIVLVIGLRYAIPESRIEIEDLTDRVSSDGNYSEFEGEKDLAVRKTIYSDYASKNKTWKHTDYKKTYEIKDAKVEEPVPFTKLKQTGLHNFGGHSIQQKQVIDINTGDSAAFEKLNGIGPVLSARIIKYRRLLGGFARIDQLKEVYGLSPETFEAIKGCVFADPASITRININSAGYRELSRFPYFEKYEITAILKYREIKGRLTDIKDLTDNKLITKEKAQKLEPYITFGN